MRKMTVFDTLSLEGDFTTRSDMSWTRARRGVDGSAAATAAPGRAAVRRATAR